MADPYANVFFSKDRIETIIEPITDDRSLDGNEVRILDRAEWMKGCPEGSESTYLHLHLLNEPGLMNKTNKVSSFNIIHT